MTQKKRILVVDDEPDMTLMVRLNLQKTGRFDVREENHPVNAIRAARDFKPDVILLDVMMPDMDGGEVLFELKEDPNLKKVPVIFITATVLPDEVGPKGGTIGGHPFIPKPFKFSALLTMIDDALKLGAEGSAK
jgi:two-component system OmpR family response regulator